MCTVSTVREDETFHLFFNRDEQENRPKAEPPQLWPATNRNPLPFLAPRDPQGGGSWLAVNQALLVVGLLNNYEPGPSDHSSLPPLSRGQVVTQLAGLESLEAIASGLQSMELRHYRPFHFFACHPRKSIIRGSWNGSALVLHQDAAAPWFLTTSSVHRESVCEYRQTLFRETPARPASLETLHHTLDAPPVASGFRMQRADARTVSVSRIDLSAKAIRYHYHTYGADGSAHKDTFYLEGAMGVGQGS